MFCLLANPVGDVCVSDFDGDGVADDSDHCPYVKHLSKTSFTDHFTVDLYPGHSDPLPVWQVAKNVSLGVVLITYLIALPKTVFHLSLLVLGYSTLSRKHAVWISCILLISKRAYH